MTDQRRENIARAMWEAGSDFSWSYLASDRQAEYRRLPDAAIAADDLRARVLALAARYERDADQGGVVDVSTRAVARRLRAVVDATGNERAPTGLRAPSAAPQHQTDMPYPGRARDGSEGHRESE